jgi:hypothetical protein
MLSLTVLMGRLHLKSSSQRGSVARLGWRCALFDWKAGAHGLKVKAIRELRESCESPDSQLWGAPIGDDGMNGAFGLQHAPDAALATVTTTEQAP